MEFREIAISLGVKWKICLRDTDEPEDFLVYRSKSYFSISRWSPRFYLPLRRDYNREPRGTRFLLFHVRLGTFSALLVCPERIYKLGVG